MDKGKFLCYAHLRSHEVGSCEEGIRGFSAFGQEICDSSRVTPNLPSRLSSPRVSTAQVFHLVIYQVRTPEIGLSLPDGLWSWVGATAILLGVYKRSSTTSRTPTTFDHPDYCSVFRSFEKGAFDGA